MPVPSNFPQGKEANEYSYSYLNFSDGAAAQNGSWGLGTHPDGEASSVTTTARRAPPQCCRRPSRPTPLYGTTPTPNRVEKVTAR
jgi:Mn-containing catalase